MGTTPHRGQRNDYGIIFKSGENISSTLEELQMGQGKLAREKGENGFSPKGPESPRPSWKVMPSFSSSSMIQLSSSEELEAGGGREGVTDHLSGRGSRAVPSAQVPSSPFTL